MTHTIKPAEIDWMSGPVVRSNQFDDIYFSDIDGLAETNHVFIVGNHLVERFAKLAEAPAPQPFTIAELGFGTGLNLLASWKVWQERGHENGQLNFFSVEKFPLDKESFSQALRKISENWPELAPMAAILEKNYPPLIAGTHSILLSKDVTLTLVLGDAEETYCNHQLQADAWFLDGFAPSQNPDMWSQELFSAMHKLSAPNASLATFSVAGFVRRGLQEAGFEVEKAPGYGRKKHMLIGKAPSKNTPLSSPKSSPQTALIIGAGIAGASLAWHLNRAGFKVTVLEKEKPACGASGNPAGLLFPRLDIGSTATARFYLHSWLYTLRLVQQLEEETGQKTILNEGGLRMAKNDKDLIKHQKLKEQHQLVLQDYLQFVSLPEAIETSGTTLVSDIEDLHILFKKGGTISPISFVSALLKNINITKGTYTEHLWNNDLSIYEVTYIDEEQRQKTLRTQKIFFANAFEASHALNDIGLQQSHGQIEISKDFHPTKAVSSGNYFAPFEGGSVFGATYQYLPDDSQTWPQEKECREKNLSALLDMIASPHTEIKSGESRGSLRCVAGDMDPVIGEVQQSNPALSNSVFASTAHGSRGLVCAPFAAHILTQKAIMAPASIENDIIQMIEPERFERRKLRRSSV